MRNYQIFQLKDTIDNKDVLFCSLDEMNRQKGHVDIDRYDAVYAGDMPPGMDLESIYLRFNVNRPEDFHGHSLSISDVIVVTSDSYRRAYYVDVFGFSELPGFFDSQHHEQENTLPNRDMSQDKKTDYLPVYRHTARYARTEGEIKTYLESRHENIACCQAIEETIRREFDGMRLGDRAVPLVLEQFGPERLSWVLANTVMMKEYDGRFSPSNRQWANSIGVVMDRGSSGNVYNDDYVVGSHPAVLNGYISLARKAMQHSTEREKASVKSPHDSKAQPADRNDKPRRSHEPSL